MPRRISNTLVPRNPVAKTLATRRGGAHQQCRTGERQQHRNALQHDLADWRDELAFERQFSSDHTTKDLELENHDEAGSAIEPVDSDSDPSAQQSIPSTQWRSQRKYTLLKLQ